MIVSPATAVSVPLIAPSVNVQTEQVARDNKVREPVAPAVALARTNAERKVKSDDKRRQQSAWDPSDHPGYEMENESEANSVSQEESQDPCSLRYARNESDRGARAPESLDENEDFRLWVTQQIRTSLGAEFCSLHCHRSSLRMLPWQTG